ncbi:MAG: RagB/SusD family nutrient uptake outer membrane protein [Chitinophagaceae bacterium]
MKSFVNVFKICFCFTLITTSCKKEFLETTPLSEFSSADVWKDPALAKTFVNGIYTGIEQSMQKYMKSVFCDEGHRRDNTACFNFNIGLMTPDGIPGWNSENWQKLYLLVRKCNLFLANIETATFDKASMTGEVRFLRAWTYYNLTSLYGGVPIISKVYDLTDDFKAPRDSYEDCIKFMVDDLDQAAKALPLVQSGADNGRSTKGAALALKARILLYAASDLHNTTIFAGYANPKLLGYTDGNRMARWQSAKDAAKAVIDMNTYSLYKPSPAPTDSVAKNYEELFISKVTVEDIWLRYYSANVPIIGENVNSLSLMNGPNGNGGQGNNAPTGNMIDAFEMRDGTKFDWNNPANAASPYYYREPRFYAYILYDGAKWVTRPSYSTGLDPLGIIHTGFFERWNSATSQVVLEGGIDSRSSPFEPNNSGQTLYLARKFLDPKVLPSAGTRQEVSWRYLRYAEVLLNCAEACIELGQDSEARTYINMIRKRAGLPDLTESGAALRARYRNERRIELMYEDQRFYDVRRWVIGPEGYAKVYKANVLYKLMPDKTTSTVPIIKHEVLETRAWIDKAYFFPILRDEMNKNNLLVQNPGYN